MDETFAQQWVRVNLRLCADLTSATVKVRPRLSFGTLPTVGTMIPVKGTLTDAGFARRTRFMQPLADSAATHSAVVLPDCIGCPTTSRSRRPCLPYSEALEHSDVVPRTRDGIKRQVCVKAQSLAARPAR